eukprot:349875-Chlamydomonas_euryale.AAC.12
MVLAVLCLGFMGGEVWFHGRLPGGTAGSGAASRLHPFNIEAQSEARRVDGRLGGIATVRLLKKHLKTRSKTNVAGA